MTNKPGQLILPNKRRDKRALASPKIDQSITILLADRVKATAVIGRDAYI